MKFTNEDKVWVLIGVVIFAAACGFEMLFGQFAAV